MNYTTTTLLVGSGTKSRARCYSVSSACTPKGGHCCFHHLNQLGACAGASSNSYRFTDWVVMTHAVVCILQLFDQRKTFPLHHWGANKGQPHLDLRQWSTPIKYRLPFDLIRCPITLSPPARSPILCCAANKLAWWYTKDKSNFTSSCKRGG